MQTRLILITLLQVFLCFSQSNTEVYLYNLSIDKEGPRLTEQRNISNNEGYDNQPSFYNDNIVLFASTINGQTDIAKYNIRDQKATWISQTAQGSEYSPIKIPNQKAISSVRLDTTGKQLLYQYDFITGKSKVLLKDLIVGYHCWYTKDVIISSVLEDGGLSLVVSNIMNKTNKTIQQKTGRSLHKIPNTKLISYISKENEQWEIRSLNPVTGETKKIIKTISGAEDMCWLIDGTILMPKGNTIFKFNPQKDTSWSIFYQFQNKEIANISRIVSNEIGSLLALVSEISPEQIVQQQLDAYNTRDIDAFVDTYADQIEVYNFPNELSYKGKDNLRKGYADFFKNTPDLHCKVVHRIVYGNKVIDEELVTINGQKINAVAIYEVNNGKIAKVTFL